MKTAASLLLLAFAAVLPARAQLFRPETVNGAVLGGIAGAIIGNNNGNHNGGQGALIGAAAGALLGSASADARDRRASVPYTYVPSRPNPVLGPVLLGGLTGAIIGNNSGGHNPWRGAAIGAGTGYVLGRIAGERVAPRRVVTYTPAAVVVYASAPAVTPAPQSVTIINNYYYSTPVTPLSDANAMFGR
jgi:outer membrane lipoprotein SlyB